MVVIGAIVLVVIAVVGVVLATRHHSSANGAPPAATVSQSVAQACTFPEPRPSASDVLWWFGQQHLPAVAAPRVRASLPVGGCSAEAFHDGRAKGATSFVIAMSSPDLATNLAQSLGGTTFARFDYVVELDPRVGVFESSYEAALVAYVRIIDPTGA